MLAPRRLGFAALLLCPVLFVWPVVTWAGGEPYELEYEVVNVFSTLVDRSGANPLRDWEVNGPDGLAWDGSGIWVTSCDTMTMLKLDADTGEQLDIWWFPRMEDMTDHLAWDGEFLWGNIHSMPGDPPPYDGRLVQIDVDSHEIVRTIEVPFRDADSMTPMGMAWDGQYLWTQDPRTNDVYRIDPVTEEGKDTPFFKTPYFRGQRLRICGIIWDEHSCLWVSDLGQGAYFQITPDTGELISYLVPPDNPDPTRYGSFRPPGVRKLFTGMTSDGDRVWIVDELEGNPLVYEIDVGFPNTGPCAHPVDDGEACVADGEPFCFARSICHEGICQPNCEIEGQECEDGFVCGDAAGAPVCIPTISEGEACEPGGHPPCDRDLVCYGEGDLGPTCQPSCIDDDECEEGFVCGADTGENVCVPEPSSDWDPPGCMCRMVVRPSGADLDALLVLAGVLLLPWWFRVRGRRKAG